MSRVFFIFLFKFAQNKKFYKNVAKFYGDLKGAEKEGRVWNDLYRYYVFKR